MRTLLLTTVLFTVACQGAQIEPKAHPSQAVVSANISLKNDSTGGTALNVNDDSATMSMRWTGAHPGDLTRLEIYNSKGHLHDQAELAVNASNETKYKLQISGSAISEYNMTGTWKALALRGDGVIVSELSFDVKP